MTARESKEKRTLPFLAAFLSGVVASRISSESEKWLPTLEPIGAWFGRLPWGVIICFIALAWLYAAPGRVRRTSSDQARIELRALMTWEWFILVLCGAVWASEVPLTDGAWRFAGVATCSLVMCAALLGVVKRRIDDGCDTATAAAAWLAGSVLRRDSTRFTDVVAGLLLIIGITISATAAGAVGVIVAAQHLPGSAESQPHQKESDEDSGETSRDGADEDTTTATAPPADPVIEDPDYTG